MPMPALLCTAVCRSGSWLHNAGEQHATAWQELHFAVVARVARRNVVLITGHLRSALEPAHHFLTARVSNAAGQVTGGAVLP